MRVGWSKMEEFQMVFFENFSLRLRLGEKKLMWVGRLNI